jgi:hypothetical protein
MVFRRKKQIRAKKDRVLSDDALIGAAKSIGSAIGAASVMVEIGKKSAKEARETRASALRSASVEKVELAAGKAEAVRKTIGPKADRAKKRAVAKMSAAKDVADVKADELRQVAADKIAPKKRRGLLSRLRR